MSLPVNKVARCSACNKALFEVVIIKKADVEWSGKAECPYCGDHSFPMKWNGMFAFHETDDCDIIDFNDESPIIVKVIKKHD